MTFYSDDLVDIAFVNATEFWVLILNGKAVKDAKRKTTLDSFVEKNSVPWERPLSA